MLKTHSCGELRLDDAGKTVELAGWVHRRRDHGGLIFIDLRDRDGLTQIVFDPSQAAQAHATAEQLRNEYVVHVRGTVRARPPGTANPNLLTGEIEVAAEQIEILNTSKTPPFYINEEVEVDESLRLKYRYLDLRRPRMRDNLILRHQVVTFIRAFLNARNFIEIETPILIKSTPEGARDYLVPSRVHPGSFYALPQSPQQLKQLLMVAGFERYYQIAKCFRDEDLRADRQPEFTQLDLEMSWVEEKDILDLTEALFTALVETLRPEMKFTRPWPRLKYADVMARYGTDKPDLRFGMEMAEVGDLVATSPFQIFQSALAAGGIVKGFAVPGLAGASRKQTDALIEQARRLGAGGLLTIALTGEGTLADLTMDDIRSPLARFLTVETIRAIAERLQAQRGDLILLVADRPAIANSVLARLRHDLGRQLGLADPNRLEFALITDFPLFEWDEKTQRWSSSHHPFTAPAPEDIPFLESDPGRVRSRSYDMVCNGLECASGSIRIHQPELQRRIFALLGYEEADIQARFGHLIEAFQYGAPPHGGIAPGIDRIVRLLAGEEDIREVIAFPKNQSAVDLLMGAPSPVPTEQLAELGIAVMVPVKAPGGVLPE